MKQLKLKLSAVPLELLPFFMGVIILSLFFINWLSSL